jgi:tetratricopeptide (TPR) repeat protein
MINDFNFDLFSFIGVLVCIQTLWQLFQNWSTFWSDRITAKNRDLAQRLAIFALVPLGVLLHEIGHSLATWQVGGTVETFQWRFFWGYIIPSGNFSPVESWWISFSGNLVSIILGLLPIAFIFQVRKRILGEILYSFACTQSIYALVAYPVMSLALRDGDWIRIYDFSIVPYASLTLIGHVLLLWGLWQLHHSRMAIRWRLARNLNGIETWKKLEANAAHHPDDIGSHLELGYFLLQHDEIAAAKSVTQKVAQVAPDDEEVKVFQVAMAYHRRDHRKAVRKGRQLLSSELSLENQLKLYRILCLSLINSRQPTEALFYGDLGLKLMPRDYRLRYYRAIAYQILGRKQEAKADFEIALAEAPNEEIRQELREYLKKSGDC